VPTYVYACTECGHRFEAQQSFTDSALTQCPQCEGRLRKVFNSVGIVFKGSGFYRTDSRATASAGSNGKSEARSESAAKTPSDGTTSSDGSPTKTAEKGSSKSSGSSGSSGSPATSGSSPKSGSAA
jgi:putative FmdB family regulatory protein